MGNVPKKNKKTQTAKANDNGSQISGNNQLQMQLSTKNKYIRNQIRIWDLFL